MKGYDAPSLARLHRRLSRLLPRARWSVFLVRPKTFLRWHRPWRVEVDLPDHSHGPACARMDDQARG
jgi:hypothetical protein